MSFLPLVKLWLWISVIASVAGWTLSALGELNRAGYAIFFFMTALLLWFGRRRLQLFSSNRASGWKKFRRRFRRPLPRSEEHTSELQSHLNLVCRLLLEKKKKNNNTPKPLKKKNNKKK